MHSISAEYIINELSMHTLSIALRYLPPNSARCGYVTVALMPRGTLYFCADVHQRGRRPPKGLGTNNMIVEAA